MCNGATGYLTTDITDLNHSNLIGHKAVADNKIARWYVQTLLCDGGSNQQVDFTIAEFVQYVPLLCLINDTFEAIMICI